VTPPLKRRCGLGNAQGWGLTPPDPSSLLTKPPVAPCHVNLAAEVVNATTSVPGRCPNRGGKFCQRFKGKLLLL